jgi:mRNA interferase HigB
VELHNKDIIVGFEEKHGDAKSPLETWARLIENNDFEHLQDLKQTIKSADYVKPWTVFNIGGNKYRLICVVNYEVKKVVIHDIMTHAEYDRGKWR